MSFSLILQSALRWTAVKLVPRPARRVSNKRAIPFIIGRTPRMETAIGVALELIKFIAIAEQKRTS